MLRRLGIMISVTALLLVFPALLALADANPSQNAAMTATPAPPTVWSTFSPTPPPPLPTPTPTATPNLLPVLAPGESVTGVLLVGQIEGLRYQFTGQAGQVVLMRVSSAQPPTPSIILVNAAGHRLGDSGGGGLYDSVLTQTLPQSGSYEIQITGRSPAAENIEYTLYLSILPSQPLAYGDRIEGHMTVDEPAYLFTFRGEAGDMVRLALTTWRFSSRLALEYVAADGTYRELATGNLIIIQTPGGVHQIGPMVLAEDAEYRVIARGTSSDKMPGAYTLSLSLLHPAPVAYGETIDAELTPADERMYFRFEAAYGDIVDIRVHAEDNADIDLNLYLDSKRLAGDEDSGDGLNPETLGYPIQEDGTYLIEIMPAVPDDSIPYSLSLARNPCNFLDEGPQRIKHDYSACSFYGNAGETARLSIEVLRGVNTPPIIVEQRGQTLLNLGSTSTERLAVDFVVPNDGPVMVRLTGGGYSNSTVEILIERLTPE